MRDIVNLGVIVGRFQVPSLHEGHRYMIEHVRRNKSHVLIIIGSTGGFPEKRNPLDFETRKQMILADFPDIAVLEIMDKPSNDDWSQKLDSIIESAYERPSSVTLFGSRDSFLESYKGKHKTEKLDPIPCKSGTEIREEKHDLNAITNHEDFRRGMIEAQKNRLAISYQVVDTVVVKDKKILLGRKNIDGEKYRFVGGFVEPKHSSLEHAIRCELLEEVPEMETAGKYKYIGSARVNDHRYRGGDDKILSAFFLSWYSFGRAVPGDDLDEVAWFDFQDVKDILINGHKEIWEQFYVEIHNSVFPENPIKKEDNTIYVLD